MRSCTARTKNCGNCWSSKQKTPQRGFEKSPQQDVGGGVLDAPQKTTTTGRPSAKSSHLCTFSPRAFVLYTGCAARGVEGAAPTSSGAHLRAHSCFSTGPFYLRAASRYFPDGRPRIILCNLVYVNNIMSLRICKFIYVSSCVAVSPASSAVSAVSSGSSARWPSCQSLISR